VREPLAREPGVFQKTAGKLRFYLGRKTDFWIRQQ